MAKSSSASALLAYAFFLVMRVESLAPRLNFYSEPVWSKISMPNTPFASVTIS